MNSSDEFDIVAIAFRRMTGHHRPGKDVAIAAEAGGKEQDHG